MRIGKTSGVLYKLRGKKGQKYKRRGGQEGEVEEGDEETKKGGRAGRRTALGKRGR